MSRPPTRFANVVLRAYPPSFRRDYGAEMTRSIVDLSRHSGLSSWHLSRRIATEAVLVAPRMRMDSLMTRSRVLGAAGTTAVVCLVLLVVAILMVAIGNPIWNLYIASLGLFVAPPVGLIAAALFLRSRRGTPSSP